MLQYFIQQSDISYTIFDYQVVSAIKLNYLLDQCFVCVIAQELSQSVASIVWVLQTLAISAPSCLILLLCSKM